jgi:hypothetical protein
MGSTVATKKRKEKRKYNQWKQDDGFFHNNDYMKLLTDGYPDPGRVLSCLTYYVANRGDCLPSIAEKISLLLWRLLADIEFNRRFFGNLTRNRIIKCNTVMKILTSLCS